MVPLRVGPQLFQILGKLAHHVPRLAFLAGRAAEQLLQFRENGRYRTFRFRIVRESGHPAHFPYKLLAADAMDLAIGIFERHPHHFEALGKLRGDVQRLPRRDPIAQFLEDREGQPLRATQVTSDAPHNIFEELLILHDESLLWVLLLFSGARHVPVAKTLDVFGKRCRSRHRSNQRVVTVAKWRVTGAIGIRFLFNRDSFASNDRERARLRTFVTFLLGKAHNSSERQIIEMLTEDTVAMEIDLAVIGRLEEAVPLFRENASNTALRRQFMRLYVAPELAKMILDPTPRGIECISDRDRQIIGLLPVDRDLSPGHAEIDPHVERPSFAVVMNRRLNHDVAPGEPWVVQLK